jgi:quercetin dioxygenase-like cupin family protein
MPEPIIVLPGHAPRPLNVIGEQITVLASGKQTGCYEIFLQVGTEGSGPPPHSHAWDEAFYVTKGEIVFGADDREVVATPGTLVHLPAGSVHWFRFGKGGGEMLSVTSREGASQVFADIDREIPVGAPDVAKLLEVGTRNGVTFATRAP